MCNHPSSSGSEKVIYDNLPAVPIVLHGNGPSHFSSRFPALTPIPQSFTFTSTFIRLHLLASCLPVVQLAGHFLVCHIWGVPEDPDLSTNPSLRIFHLGLRSKTTRTDSCHSATLPLAGHAFA